jgi:hypothetical protein
MFIGPGDFVRQQRCFLTLRIVNLGTLIVHIFAILYTFNILTVPVIDSRCCCGVVTRVLRVCTGVHALARTTHSRRSNEELHLSTAKCQSSPNGCTADGRTRDVRVLVRCLQSASDWLEPGKGSGYLRRLAEEVCCCKY